MPTVTHGATTLRYDVTGAGEPLLLLHGFTSSGAIWTHVGVTAALGRHFRCIAYDARGHGASSRPHDPAAYTLAARVEDALAVLDACGAPRAHVLGYSLGGWTAFGLVDRAPARVRSLVIGGAHPFEDRSWEAFHGVDGSDPAAFLAALEAVLQQPLPATMRAPLLANDLRALAAAAHPRASQEAALPRIAVPALLYAGGRDPRCALVREAAARIPGAQCAELPGLDHLTAFLRAEAMLSVVTPFLLAQRAAA